MLVLGGEEPQSLGLLSHGMDEEGPLGLKREAVTISSWKNAQEGARVTATNSMEGDASLPNLATSTMSSFIQTVSISGFCFYLGLATGGWVVTMGLLPQSPPPVPVALGQNAVG